MAHKVIKSIMVGVVGVGSAGISALPGLAVATTNDIGLLGQAVAGVAPTAEAGLDQTVDEKTKVFLKGSGTDSDGTIVGYKWTQTSGPSVTIANRYKAAASFVAPDVGSQQQLNFRLVVTDNSGMKADDSVQITVDPLAPSLGGVLLNDTGIADCVNSGIYGICQIALPQGQDGQFGRDATQNYNSDGHAGFSFTKLDVSGAPIVDAASFPCVKDNVTGLVWEIKTNDRGPHHKDWTYTWYNPDPLTNGGSAGSENGGVCSDSLCDTYHFVQFVNERGWCGFNDWRMPSLEELRSIVNYTHINSWAAIDSAYFPNTNAGYYWSVLPSVSASEAWRFNFDMGYSTERPLGKEMPASVRLVRGGM